MASADSLNVEAQFTEPGTEILGIWFVELFYYPIDRRAVALVAPAICRRHEVLPIGVENERLVLSRWPTPATWSRWMMCGLQRGCR